MKYTADSKERVYEAVDMLALVGRRVELSRRGVDSYFGLCPFHTEHTPSFHVRPDEKHYHCFGCQMSGDPFDFVMETEGLGFVEALETLADMFGVKLETVDEDPEAAQRRQRRDRLYSLLGRAAVYYSRYLWEAREAADARAYLLGRGFTEETLREFRVGYAPSAWDKVLMASRKAGYTDEELHAAGLVLRSKSRPGSVYDRFRRRIMFPAADARGKVVGFGARAMVDDPREAGYGKYVNTAEGELYHKREQLFGIDLARSAAARSGRIILVEGYTDVMALHQAGIRNAVGIMGTALTEEQIAILERSVKVLELCLDADSAGQEAMLKAAKVAAGRKLELRVVPLPRGADPGDLIQREGPEALRRLVESSQPFVVFQVERIIDADGVRSAEDKDRAIAELRPVFAEVPESVLRDELTRRVAARLDLTEARLAELLGGPLRRRSPVSIASGRGASAPTADLPAHVDRSIHNEQAFLALCIALPAEGERTLAAIDTDQLLTGQVMRRAARHLIGRLATPMVDLPSEDEELARAVAELVRRSGSSVEISPDRLEHARLLLELSRVERAIKRARVERGGDDRGADITALARERMAIKSQMHAVTTRLERTV